MKYLLARSGVLVPASLATWRCAKNAPAVITPSKVLDASGQPWQQRNRKGQGGIVRPRAGILSLMANPVNRMKGPPLNGAAQTIAINGGNNQQGVGLLGTALTAIVKDSSNNPVAGVTVTFAVTAGGGSVGTPSATTNGSGIASSTWTLGSSGTQTVTATSAGLTGSPLTFSAVVNAGLAEPVYDPGTQTLVFADNMDEYTTATAMGAAPQAQMLITPHPAPLTDSQPVDTTRNAVITPGRLGTGKCIRLTYTSAAGEVDAAFMVWNTPTTIPQLKSHYCQFWARVLFPGTPIGSNTIAVKWFEFEHQYDRVQWNSHDHTPGPPGPGGSTQTMFQVYDQSRETTGQGDQPVGPYFADLVGDWHRYTYAYRPNSAPGARDGWAQAWVDGAMIINISNAAIGVTPTGGDRPWCAADDVDALMNNDGLNVPSNSAQIFGGPSTVPSVPTFTIDYDDYAWWYTP